MALAVNAPPGTAGFNGAYQQVYDITALAADDGNLLVPHTLGAVPTEYWIEDTHAASANMTRWSVHTVQAADVTIARTGMAGPLGSTSARLFLRLAHSEFIGA